MTQDKHLGFPLPSEMFHQKEEKKIDFKKHQAICDLLDIDLTCPHCHLRSSLPDPPCR